MTEPGLFPNPKGEQPELPVSAADSGPPTSASNPLDVPQVFPPATSDQVRDELEKLIARDLLGPWGGDEEELPPRGMGPRERYLVGMLGPRPRSEPRAADPDPDDIGVRGDATETDLPEILTPQSLGRLWASSMGLSFAVSSDVDVLAVTASWGAYDHRSTEGEDGRRATVWRRKPMQRLVEVRLDRDASQRIPLTDTDPDVPGVFLSVEVRPRDRRRIVQVALLNNQLEPPSNADTAWLFQCRLRVTAADGHEGVFLPIDDPADDVRGIEGDVEEEHLRLLYRKVRRYANGRNVAVHAEVRPGERRAWELTTQWLPTYEVPATVAPSGPDSRLAGVELSMDALAEADPATLRRGLAPLVDGYVAWLDERQAEIPTVVPEPLRPSAESAIFTARRIADRIRAGITLLTDPAAPRHDEALRAFRFANRAMALQRRHTEIGREREATKVSYVEAEKRVNRRGAEAASWRPFQLAFVLLNLPALTDPGHPERAADRSAIVDLLFFPTGGGKTEAYLGLTAYTFAIRRFQGVIGTGANARSGSAGVAVLMRYTLRLLTAQQFQRAAALVCAAEYLRRQDEATWGGEPFRIGLWVGGGVSPNWYDEAAKQIAEARDAGHGQRTNVLQTLACPWCGERLQAHRDLHPDETSRRVLLFCPRAEGADACPFSRTQSAEGLPILTVDEEIYRLLPSLVIATVDKLAQLPWRGFAGMLFGRVREWCPRHGYRHDDLDERTSCSGRHRQKDHHAAVTSRPVPRLRPPDLIIQDELHLISGALGTTVGLFEAAVDELCTWELPSGAATGPKIVASTATTKRAAAQVLGVFGRDLAVFPPPVIDVDDTFFSRQVPVTPDQPGRRYLGVCAHGTRLKAAEIRLAEILLLAGQTLFDTYGAPADPYMTLVGYFNATRELAGMRRYLDDDVTTRIRTHGRARGLSNRIVTATGMLTISELTSRISSADISEALKRLEVGFDQELDTTGRRRAINDEMRRALANRTTSNPKISLHPVARRFYNRQEGDQEGEKTPVDAVLATSMLQVGVDVSRFGLMLIVGQPKNTAEYIQASSRVGRDQKRPGLVVTLYNWSRPRDLAHYEDFEYYHATFYRQVEALSVTPFTRRAIDRGAAGTFVAAVRHVNEQWSRNADAHDVPLEDAVVTRVVDRMLARAETVAGDRGRGNLRDRLVAVKEAWNRVRTGSARIGYTDSQSTRHRLVGLLHRAGSGKWDVMTVGMSMRETENEVNVLVPAGEEIFSPLYGAPPWRFGEAVEPATDEEAPEGDELGVSTLDGGAA
ncbi:MAG: helicase [Micromonosporaceae bacterium]|nr:helicase [Micromonosporaceae bacterium]